MPFVELEKVPTVELVPGFRVKMLHSNEMTFAFWDIDAGGALPEHFHINEQVATILEGEFELTISGESRVLRVGSVAVIPGNALHSGRALTDCKILDAFYPIREDYLKYGIEVAVMPGSAPFRGEKK